jgi:NAD(P)-dependent dehydrogenase (short-subunit alcohol dehydrogenase family)
METKVLDRMLALTLWLGYDPSRAAVVVIAKQGHVVAKAGVDRMARAGAYSASKAAALALLDALAVRRAGLLPTS